MFFLKVVYVYSFIESLGFLIRLILTGSGSNLSRGKTGSGPETGPEKSESRIQAPLSCTDTDPNQEKYETRTESEILLMTKSIVLHIYVDL